MVQKLSFISLIFHAIPEGIALTALVFAFIKVPLKWYPIITIGLLVGGLSYIVRLLPITFGIHIVILTFWLVMLIGLTTKKRVSSVVISVMMGVIVLAISEMLLTGFLLVLTNLQWEQVEGNQWLRVLFGSTHTLLIGVIALLLNRANLRQEKLN